MTAAGSGSGPPASEPGLRSTPDAVISVPEIRDYERINAELTVQLDQGLTSVRLRGAEGQRLLLAGLAGSWHALVEIEGSAGPELAAGLDAPGLTVVARGAAADGAGARLRAGRLILLGPAGDALAIGQEGGLIIATAGAGHRAGLNQRGGVLIVRGPVGRLAGERQAGGHCFVSEERLGPHAGHGRRGGAFVRTRTDGVAPPEDVDPADAIVLGRALSDAAPWITPGATGSAATNSAVPGE